MFFVHVAGVFATLLIMPGEVWLHAPLVPTMEGQYILKNIVLVVACMAVATRQSERHSATPRAVEPGMRVRPS